MTDEEFIEWVDSHAEWYDAESTKWGRILTTCRILSLVATIASIVVAAAVPPDVFADWGRWAIIGTSILTAISTEILSQLKVREMEELREDGNLEINELSAYTKQRLHEANGEAKKRTALMDEVRTKVAALERRQHKGHVAIERTTVKTG